MLETLKLDGIQTAYFPSQRSEPGWFVASCPSKPTRGLVNYLSFASRPLIQTALPDVSCIESVIFFSVQQAKPLSAGQPRSDNNDEPLK